MDLIWVSKNCFYYIGEPTGIKFDVHLECEKDISYISEQLNIVYWNIKRLNIHFLNDYENSRFPLIEKQ